EVLGVAIASGEQQRDLRFGDESILLNSYDSPCFLDRRVCDWPVEAGAPDALHRVAAGAAIAVSRSFADLHVTSLGDTRELATSDGIQPFTVALITSCAPQSAILMSRELYRRLWKDDLITYAHVAVAEGHTPQAVAAAIASDFGEKYRLRVLETPAMIEYFAAQAREAFSSQYLMEAIALLLILIGIGDTLAAGV